MISFTFNSSRISIISEINVFAEKKFLQFNEVRVSLFFLLIFKLWLEHLAIIEKKELMKRIERIVKKLQGKITE